MLQRQFWFSETTHRILSWNENVHCSLALLDQARQFLSSGTAQILSRCTGHEKTYSTWARFSRVRPHHQALRTNARGSDSNRAAHRAAWHRTQAGAQEQSVVEPPSPDGFQQLAAGGARVCAERWVLSPHILHAHHRHSSARAACPRCRRDSVSWVHPLPAVLEHCAPAEGDGTLCLDGVPARPARPARSCSRSRQERSSLDQLR